MSLDPFCSLSPNSPSAYTYDPANPSAPYVSALLWSCGSGTRSGPRTLPSQYANNQLLIAFDPVADTDQTVTNWNADFDRHSAVFTRFRGINVNTNNQYLLIFRLAKTFGSPIAQFFIGSDFVRAEPLTGEPHDDIAILLDVPGNYQYVHATVRLAASGSQYYHGFFFKGVDCYLL